MDKRESDWFIFCIVLFISKTCFPFFHNVKKTSEPGETAHLLGCCYAFHFMGNVSLVILFPFFGSPESEQSCESSCWFVCLIDFCHDT